MRRGLLTAVALAVSPAAAAAQTTPVDSALVAALRLVTEGRGDSARALVRARLREIPVSDSLYAEALFAAGAVAASVDSALFHFRRVALDYPNTRWADDALLRVAQLAFAAGDFETAQRSVSRILNDYPFSDVRADAAYWRGRVLLDEDRLAEACGFLRQAQAEAGENVELANRVRFYLQRCTAVAVDTSRADAPAPAAGPPRFAVQVAAVRTAAAADEVMRSLRAAGYEARAVRDADGLLKVRVGHFRTRAEAERVQLELRRRVGGQPFIVEER